MARNRGWLVPDDWNGEDYTLWMLCAPCSPQWNAIVNGSVYELSRARNWDADSGDFLAARDLGKEIFFTMANCNDGLVQIANAIALLARNQGAGGFDCGCPGGTGTEFDGINEQQPTVFGPGEQWPTEQDYLDDKCHIANIMFRDYRELFVELNALNIDTLTAGTASLAIGTIAAVVAGLFATGPIGLTIGVIAGLASLFIGAPLFDLGDIVAELDANKTDLVCALYNATDADTAKADFEQILGNGPLTLLETTAISLVGVRNFYNQLFTPLAGYESEVVTSPVDCADCFTGVTIRWMTGNDGVLERGSGDLTPDGTSRVLSSVQDTNNFHYIAFGLYEEPKPRVSYNGICNEPPIPLGLGASGNSTFRIQRVSDTRGTDSGTKGTSCVNSQYTEVFNTGGGFGFGQNYNVIWVQLISNTAFTFTVELEYTPS